MLWYTILQSSLIRIALTVVFTSCVECTTLPLILNASQLAASQVLGEPLSYDFPNQNSLANLFPMQLCNDLILEEATIDQLQEYMSHGRLSSSQLALCYLQRIYQTDSYIKYVSRSDPIFSSDINLVATLIGNGRRS